MSADESSNVGCRVELWLDCRARAPVEAAPLACDKRLLHAGLALCQRDLACDGEQGGAIDNMGSLAGVLCTGSEAEVNHKAPGAIGTAEWVILDGEALVPSEALLVAASTQGTRIAVSVRSSQHLVDLEPVLSRLGALVINVKSSAGLWDEAVLARMNLNRFDVALDVTLCGGIYLPATEKLKGARVDSIQVVDGHADRVCLDLIQNLAEGEGVLVGSSAHALCFLHAGTAPLDKHPARPFRISAGPVHQFVALPDGRIKYLSDVSAGDQVLVVDVRSIGTMEPPASRSVAVGRCHVEQCPVVCIHLQFEGSRSQLFLERSAAVRVHAMHSCDVSFKALPVTELCKGDEVLVHWMSTALAG